MRNELFDFRNSVFHFLITDLKLLIIVFHCFWKPLYQICQGCKFFGVLNIDITYFQKLRKFVINDVISHSRFISCKIWWIYQFTIDGSYVPNEITLPFVKLLLFWCDLERVWVEDHLVYLSSRRSNFINIPSNETFDFKFMLTRWVQFTSYLFFACKIHVNQTISTEDSKISFFNHWNLTSWIYIRIAFWSGILFHNTNWHKFIFNFWSV